MDYDINLAELIHRGGVYYDVSGSSPKEIYKNITSKITYPKGLTPEILYTELCQREELMSTGVGNGIALPHPRYPLLKNYEDQRIVVCYLKTPLTMSSPDSKPVSVMFILLTSSSQVHLKVLSQLAFLFQNSDFKKELESKPDESKLITAIKKVI